MSSRKKPRLEIKNPANLEELLQIIYRVRCNLFHGSKNPKDQKDKDLVHLSGQILEKWIAWSYQKLLKEKR